MKFYFVELIAVRVSRSPRGERGLKFLPSPNPLIYKKSLSSRRAWIEMFVSKCDDERTICRSPRGERGLKLSAICQRILKISRSPRGERGLKLSTRRLLTMENQGRSPRGERGLKCESLLFF